MKQLLKKLLRLLPFGQRLWGSLASCYHKYRRSLKRAIQKKRDFERYVYPVVGKHPGKADVFLYLSPTYKNLGDHAIAKAELGLFREWGIPVREVTIDVVQILAKHGDYGVFGRSTVMVTGGGFLGTLWPHMHEMTTRLIEQNPGAKIVVLPNTLYFAQTPEGEALFEDSIAVFNRPNVKRVYLREKTSFDMVSGKYATARLVPDMVMGISESRPETVRKGCLICLRNDKERTLSDVQTAAVYDSAKRLFGDNVGTTDMRNETDVPLEQRQEKLEQKFDQFRRAELVITDRLHGMIFSAVTGTPCIVLNSRSHKLAGCYEWLKTLEYIRFCEKPEDICEIYGQMPHEGRIYDTEPLRPQFDQMKQELISMIRE